MHEGSKKAICGSQGVRGIIHLRAMHLGPDDLLVSTKVEYDHDMSIADLAAAIDRTEVAMRAVVPADMTIHIEPDIRRNPSA